MELFQSNPYYNFLATGNRIVKTTMKVFILALCLVQALASPIVQPLENSGDLDLPGFKLLNMALNDGIVDVAPGLARMPHQPNGDLAGVLATFFEEMAFSCYFYGRVEMAEDFHALKEMAPDIETLAITNNVVPETWDLLLALRSEGLSVINLRIFVAEAIEVMEETGGELITDITTQVYDLKSDKQELIEYKVAVKELIEEFNRQFAIQVADVAEILRILANQLGDVGNNRDEVAADMMALFRAVNKQREDLYNAVTYVTDEWARIKKGLTKIVGAEKVAPITVSVKNLADLTKKELTDLTGALLHTITTARESYEAMLRVFPATNTK